MYKYQPLASLRMGSIQSGMDAERRIKKLVELIRSTPDEIFQEEAREDLVYWLEFICAGWDSTYLMRWYPAFSSVIGFYLSGLQEQIDRKKLARDQAAAQARKHLEARQSRVTNDQAKAEAVNDLAYVNVLNELSKLERLYAFLSSIREGMNPDIITAFGHNQRQEMRSDQQ